MFSRSPVVELLAPMVRAFRHKHEFHLILRIHFPGMDARTAADAIEIFGDEVIPGLRAVEETGT